MTREEAINEIKSWAIPSEKGREVLETLIPELTKSEDERIRKWLLEQIHNMEFNEDEYHLYGLKAVEYLEKQKEQKPAEWSEEDELMMKAVIGILDESDHPKLCHWLKSLKPQPKQEWSEEDENARQNLIAHFEGKILKLSGEAKKEAVDWLKSLRPSWKPSEEQMNRLFSIVAALRKDYCDDMADFLANLYTDLKKLM